MKEKTPPSATTNTTPLDHDDHPGEAANLPQGPGWAGSYRARKLDPVVVVLPPVSPLPVGQGGAGGGGGHCEIDQHRRGENNS